ncbi:MAG: hypothetical protein E6Z55_06735 [Peptoniphilus harei]|nr:hypothetical protein [Peptoniphilus harei]
MPSLSSSGSVVSGIPSPSVSLCTVIVTVSVTTSASSPSPSVAVTVTVTSSVSWLLSFHSTVGAVPVRVFPSTVRP